MSTLGFLKGTHGLLLGAGVLIGSVGAKVLTSDGAKRVYVEAVAASATMSSISARARSTVSSQACFARSPAATAST